MFKESNRWFSNAFSSSSVSVEAEATSDAVAITLETTTMCHDSWSRCSSLLNRVFKPKRKFRNQVRMSIFTSTFRCSSVLYHTILTEWENKSDSLNLYAAVQPKQSDSLANCEKHKIDSIFCVALNRINPRSSVASYNKVINTCRLSRSHDGRNGMSLPELIWKWNQIISFVVSCYIIHVCPLRYRLVPVVLVQI